MEKDQGEELMKLLIFFWLLSSVGAYILMRIYQDHTNWKRKDSLALMLFTLSAGWLVIIIWLGWLAYQFACMSWVGIKNWLDKEARW